jgi:argininosuccinate lyase
MLRRATVDFTSATDLADALVRHADLSFRDAHHVVGAVVREAMDRGLPANEITGAMVQAAATAQIGRGISLPDEVVRDCLDPARSIRARTLPGGPAPDAVRKLITTLRTELDRSESENAGRKATVAAARATLRREVAERARR